MKFWTLTPLWLKVFIGLILGMVVGTVFGEKATILAPLGELFLRLIKMLIVPLVFFTLVAGVVAMGDPKKLGSLGARAIGLYLVTTFFAVSLGLTVGSLMKPGAGVELTTSAADIEQTRAKLDKATQASSTVAEQILAIVPTNPFDALMRTDFLQIIFFSIFFGIGILLAGDKGKAVGQFFESASEVTIKLTGLVMELAPIGVFALIAAVIGDKGFGVLIHLGWLAIALYLCCFIHMVFIYGGLIRILLNLPLLRFFRGILNAQIVAYSTSTSSGTLPVTIRNVRENLGVSKSVAGSVLPLGATINMDGTAIYLGLITMFAVQATGIAFDPSLYLAIAATATLVSIGTASIPSASLFLATTVLQVAGLGEEQALIVIALIFPFDRLLDMMRTVTNVTGDAAVATAVAKWQGEFDEKIFKNPAN